MYGKCNKDVITGDYVCQYQIERRSPCCPVSSVARRKAIVYGPLLAPACPGAPSQRSNQFESKLGISFILPLQKSKLSVLC